jgi:hypothetical protein
VPESDDLAERTGDLEHEIGLLRRYNLEQAENVNGLLDQLGAAMHERDRYRTQVEQLLTALAVAGGVVKTFREGLAAAAGVPLTPELDAGTALAVLIGERDDALTALAELVGYEVTDKAHAALDGA